MVRVYHLFLTDFYASGKKVHISEGVLSAPVLAGGAVLALTGVAAGLRRLDEKGITACALLSSVFFVGSLVHVPIGFANAHLLLCGLLGVLLGWAAFPAIFVALLLQAVLFQYGGLTTLGVNTFTMGSAAVVSFYVYHLIDNAWKSGKGRVYASFFAGALGVAVSAVLTAAALSFTDEGFKVAAYALIAAHIPVMLTEGLITSLTVTFVARIKPALLEQKQINPL